MLTQTASVPEAEPLDPAFQKIDVHVVNSINRVEIHGFDL